MSASLFRLSILAIMCLQHWYLVSLAIKLTQQILLQFLRCHLALFLMTLDSVVSSPPPLSLSPLPYNQGYIDLQRLNKPVI